MTLSSTLKSAGSGVENAVRGARTEEPALGKWAMAETLSAPGLSLKITEDKACGRTSTCTLDKLRKKQVLLRGLACGTANNCLPYTSPEDNRRDL